MRTFPCTCGSALYFDSTVCLNCKLDTGMCPHCKSVTALVRQKPDGLKCGSERCGVNLFRCANFVENGCNRCVLADDTATSMICDYCQTTTLIPDLSVDGHREKWRKLERAKRRVLYVLDLLGLPFRQETPDGFPGVSFEFKSDTTEAVHTGHDNGCITINLREADDVEREKARVAFQEPQRTLVGHFRHELGHYFWDRLVQGQREAEFRELFGDELNPPYATALENYYATGPDPNWKATFISAYASMHPWEDFAETFGAYLDMVAVLDTARAFGAAEVEAANIDSMIVAYQKLGVMANELNRDMGLVDLVPEVFLTPIVCKMRFIHSLTHSAQQQAATDVVCEVV